MGLMGLIGPIGRTGRIGWFLAALDHLKNSLKSGGSWIVAIDDLSHQLQGLQPLLRGLGQPIGLLVGWVQSRATEKAVLSILAEARLSMSQV